MEKTRLKIGFYNPYFNGLGGGERYTLALASHWSKSHDVTIFWNDPSILAESENRFCMNLSGVRVVPNVFREGSMLQKIIVSRSYDILFFLSDGSSPLSFAKHNILHFQMPFKSVETNILKRFDAVVCNSLFTQKFLDPKMARNAQVIYPPVLGISSDLTKKEKIILSVGRFSGIHEAKKQSVMIEAFESIEKNLPNWKLILAGGLLSVDKEYFQTLHKRIKSSKITLVPNISYEQLVRLYTQASLYWHAAGYKESDPQYFEHFGISTVEAMSAGALPIVYKGGGQPEIVEHGKNGFLWSTQNELIEFTQNMITNTKYRWELALEAIKKSQEFSEGTFFASFDKLLVTLYDH